MSVVADRWSIPEQINLDTAERRKLVAKVGVVSGQIVDCWVVDGEAPQPIETPQEDE